MGGAYRLGRLVREFGAHGVSPGDASESPNEGSNATEFAHPGEQRAKTRLGSVIFMDPEGKRYAVNGTATAHHPELPEIDEIWAPDPTNPGAKLT